MRTDELQEVESMIEERNLLKRLVALNPTKYGHLCDRIDQIKTHINTSYSEKTINLRDSFVITFTDIDNSTTVHAVNSNGDPSQLQKEVVNQIHQMALGLKTKVSTRLYSDDIPGYADVFTISEWNEVVSDGQIMSDDGTGYWCKDGKESGDEVFSSPQLDATHVAWYNK